MVDVCVFPLILECVPKSKINLPSDMPLTLCWLTQNLITGVATATSNFSQPVNTLGFLYRAPNPRVTMKKRAKNISSSFV